MSECDICGDTKKPNNATCGAPHCVSARARMTRAEGEPAAKYQAMKRMYGAENPWTTWLRDAMRKQEGR